jgi:hypothetical protein
MRPFKTFSISGLLFLILSFFYFSCEKSSLPIKPLENSLQKQSVTAVESDVQPLVLSHGDSVTYNTLVAKYHLVIIRPLPAGLTPLQVTTVAAGSTFFDNATIQNSKVYTNKGTGQSVGGNAIATKGSVLIKTSPSGFSPLEDGDPQAGTDIVEGIFGNWSNMNIQFTYTINPDQTYTITDVSSTVSGFVFGISYNQTPNGITTNQIAGVADFYVNGYYTAGITVGGSLAVGWSQQYYYHVTYLPVTAAYTVVSGVGHH